MTSSSKSYSSSGWTEKRNVYQEQDWSSNKKPFIKYSDIIGSAKPVSSLSHTSTSTPSTTSGCATASTITNILFGNKNLKQASALEIRTKQSNPNDSKVNEDTRKNTCDENNPSTKSNTVSHITALTKCTISSSATKTSAVTADAMKNLEALKDVQRAIDAARSLAQSVNQEGEGSNQQAKVVIDGSNESTKDSKTEPKTGPKSPTLMQVNELLCTNLKTPSRKSMHQLLSSVHLSENQRRSITDTKSPPRSSTMMQANELIRSNLKTPQKKSMNQLLGFSESQSRSIVDTKSPPRSSTMMQSNELIRSNLKTPQRKSMHQLLGFSESQSRSIIDTKSPPRSSTMMQSNELIRSNLKTPQRKSMHQLLGFSESQSRSITDTKSPPRSSTMMQSNELICSNLKTPQRKSMHQLLGFSESESRSITDTKSPPRSSTMMQSNELIRSNLKTPQRKSMHQSLSSSNASNERQKNTTSAPAVGEHLKPRALLDPRIANSSLFGQKEQVSMNSSVDVVPARSGNFGDLRVRDLQHSRVSPSIVDPRLRTDSRFNLSQSTLMTRHRMEHSEEFQDISRYHDFKEYDRAFRDSKRHSDVGRIYNPYYVPQIGNQFRGLRRSKHWSMKYPDGDDNFFNSHSCPSPQFMPNDIPGMYDMRRQTYHDFPFQRNEGYDEFTKSSKLDFRSSSAWNVTNENKENPSSQPFVVPSYWGGVITFHLVQSPESGNGSYLRVPEKRIF